MLTHSLTSSFFARPTLQVAKSLLGKYLVRRIGRSVISGKISEVEAYVGERDLACHASRGRTGRTQVMYGEPGTLYVYLVYGMYWCLNIVTERKDYPAAVLIRGVIPAQGIPAMLKRRKRGRLDLRGLADGPGKLCRAFGITGAMNGKRLGNSTLTIEDRGEFVPSSHITALPRVGVDYAKHCAKYPWRFLLAG